MIDTVDAREAVLNVARALRWVRETDGPNRGEVVDEMTRECGLRPPQPWCAAFLSFCGHAALDLRWPLPLVAGCATLAEAAQAQGTLHVLTGGVVPERGAIFLLWGEAKQRYHHTGFVLGPDSVAGYWRTCEGNTNEDGSPEGTGVFTRRRRFGDKDAIITWWTGGTV